MEAINCKACRIEIEEAEAVSQSLSARARAHAEACLPCRTFSEERQALRRLVGSLETVAAPPDFDFRLRARLAASNSENSRRFTWPGLATSVSSIALAASLALAIAVAAIVFKQVDFDGSNVARPTEALVTAPVNNSQTKSSVDTPETVTPDDVSIDERTAVHQDKARRLLIAANWRRGSAAVFGGRKFKIERNTTATASDGDTDIRSNDFDVHKPSPQIYPPGVYNPAVDPNPSIIIPIRALIQPAKFLFGDGRGRSHIFSLRTVSFGSEKLIEQKEDTRLMMTLDASDIW